MSVRVALNHKLSCTIERVAHVAEALEHMCESWQEAWRGAELPCASRGAELPWSDLMDKDRALLGKNN